MRKVAAGVGLGFAIGMIARFRKRLRLPGGGATGAEDEVRDRMTEGLPDEELGPPESTLPEPPPGAK
jgi:hypothetical protein